MLEKWQSTYDEKTRQNLKTTSLKAPIGMNAIGRAVAVTGHISGEPNKAVHGMVVCTTCTGWRMNKNTFNEKLQRVAGDKEGSHIDESFKLHLVMYEDGTSHWENLLDKKGKYTYKWIEHKTH